MCFDTQSSLLAWSISYSISIYLYIRNKRYDRWNAAFIMTLATIQLLEAGIWYSIDSGRPDLNRVVTGMLILVLLLQPIIQSGMGYVYTKSTVLAFLAIVLLGVLLWKLLTIRGEDYHSSPGPGGHLIWESSSGSALGPAPVVILYLVGLFLPLMYMSYSVGIPLILTGAITAMLSMWATHSGEFSSYWCYTTVIYALVALFL